MPPFMYRKILEEMFMINQLNNFISNMNNRAATMSNNILDYIRLPNIAEDERLANYMTMLKEFKTDITNQFNILYQNVHDSQYSEISYELCSSTFLKILTFMFGYGGILYHRIFNNPYEFAYPKTDLDEWFSSNLVIIWRDIFTFKWNAFTNNHDAYRSFIDIQFTLDNIYQGLENSVASSDVDRVDVYNQALRYAKESIRSMFITNFNQNVLNKICNQNDFDDIYTELENSDLIAILTDYSIHKSFINFENVIPLIYNYVINESYIYYIIKDYLYYNIVGLFEMLFTTIDNYQYIETSIICQGIRTIMDKIGGNL